MKAAVLTGYDKNGRNLELRDVPMPEMKDNDVLVKIRTAGVNPLDNMIIKGEVKMIVPYSFPLIMGNEFAGIVEKVGKSVRKFKPGDRVYGRMELKRIGAFAEYTAIDQGAIARVPEYLSDEEAASVPLTALTAMQALAFGGLDPVYGARPLKRLIQRQVVDNIANLIIDGEVREGDTVSVDLGADDVLFARRVG